MTRTNPSLVISAHEQERIRLARELHDDVAQRVAFLSVELSELRFRLAALPVEFLERLARLSIETAEIGSELHRISHALHPARLERLGLEAALRSFCIDLAEAKQITVRQEVHDLPMVLGADVALCLYRITQGALHNVVKHSRATHATVTLTTNNGDLVLSVRDNGIGFDPLAVSEKETLGLVSVRERARLVQGQLQVSSKLGEGTVVQVRVPLDRCTPAPVEECEGI
jgi:signal transduction histidine kinase